MQTIDVQEEEDRILAGIVERRETLITSPEAEHSLILEQIIHWETELEKLRGLTEYARMVAIPLISDRECKRVDIVVLKYRDDAVEEHCMRLLNQHTNWPYKLTWFDNRHPLDPELATGNFAKIWNRLTRESTCDYVLIMDTDAFVTEKGWLAKMMESFDPEFEACLSHDNPGTIPAKVGMAVPVTHNAGAHTIQGMHRSDMGMPFLTRAQVSGFFFLFKKEMFDDIGPFDERFYLHGQDSEWIDRVIDSDWQIVVRPDVFVDHTVSASIKRAEFRGVIDLHKERLYTKVVYDAIRAEKEAGVYTPYAD